MSIENFEKNVPSGWLLSHNNNPYVAISATNQGLTQDPWSKQNGDRYFTNFLGRFASGDSIKKTFNNNEGNSVLEFDLYRLDSWDGEAILISLNGANLITQPFEHGKSLLPAAVRGSGLINGYLVKWELLPKNDFRQHGFGIDPDESIKVRLLLPRELSEFELGITSTLDQSSNDESWGIDNVSFSDSSITSDKTTTLASTISRLILTGTGNINGTGNALNNYLTGNGGNNVLDGGAGNDILAGGNGNDTYIVDSIYDSIIENANEGIDLVKSSVNWTLGANVENLTLTGTASLTGTGNELNNIIIGNGGNNVLDGGAGDDTLVGSTGDDILIGGLGNDVMKGGAGNDTYYVDSTGDTITDTSGTDTVVASISWTLGTKLENLTLISWTLDSKLENLTLTGTDPLTGIGNTLKNTIIGNAGNNVLDGMGGTDILTGGLGADVFRFSTRPNFGSSSADHITDFKGSEGDVLQINKPAFGLAANATVSLISISSAADLTTALASASTFVYDSSSGNLYWNQNGTKSGYGSGGIFAVLDNHATLSSSNISLV